jgi:hypothetical protein
MLVGKETQSWSEGLARLGHRPVLLMESVAGRTSTAARISKKSHLIVHWVVNDVAAF